MAEAHGAWDQYIMSQEENEAEKLEAFRIELSDCFHFLVGLCILSGITPSMLINESPYHETEEDDVSRHWLPYDVFYEIFIKYEQEYSWF
jgi:hypothetical protein